MWPPVLTVIVVLAYSGSAGLLYRRLTRPADVPVSLAVPVLVAVIGLAAHALLLYQHWVATAPPDVAAIHIFATSAFLMVLLLALSHQFGQSIFHAGLVALPIAGVIVAVEGIAPGPATPLSSIDSGTQVHIIASLLAFGLLSLAAVYAVFIALLDRFLRQHRVNALVRALPPLETLERLLSRLVLIGFLLLSVSLISGLMFVDNLLAQHLAHKTLLSFLAWGIFALLLFGRWRWGWRGRIAVRLTLAGIVLLLLSYFGSKWVLEQILNQNWQI